jgi:hypothetical protein
MAQKYNFAPSLCIVERKDGARLFAQIKACAIYKAQSFALRSL